nr:DUF3265 domain-containing protein [Vibrio vulnificus]
AVSFGGESALRKVGLCGIHPLTRRYVSLVNSKHNKKSASALFLREVLS